MLEVLNLDKETSDKVFYKNLEAVTGQKLVKVDRLSPCCLHGERRGIQ